ncbi:MAG: ABC transporter permease [Oscillospiraceae bacterium]|nr:ABC transporter permease [Oscillospiraceae bacterium]
MRRRNFTLIIGLVLTAGLLLVVVGGNLLWPFGAAEIGAGGRLDSPSLTHLFGTDHVGRDVFARVLDGAGTTLLVALGTVLIGSLGGLLVGAVAGYFGGWLDEIVMRISDGLTAFPSVLLALVAMSFTGAGMWNVVWILGLLFIPSFARVARGEFARCRNLDYVKRARLIGASHLRIMWVHILPNTLPVFLSTVAIGFNNAVLAEASMSFLGLGVQQPQVSLGRMLADSQGYLFNAPWVAISTGAAVVLLVLAFSLLSDGLQRKGLRRIRFLRKT